LDRIVCPWKSVFFPHCFGERCYPSLRREETRSAIRVSAPMKRRIAGLPFCQILRINGSARIRAESPSVSVQTHPRRRWIPSTSGLKSRVWIGKEATRVCLGTYTPQRESSTEFGIDNASSELHGANQLSAHRQRRQASRTQNPSVDALSGMSVHTRLRQRIHASQSRFPPNGGLRSLSVSYSALAFLGTPTCGGLF
jgi:hypothetical protein